MFTELTPRCKREGVFALSWHVFSKLLNGDFFGKKRFSHLIYACKKETVLKLLLLRRVNAKREK
jgi:hypothetical protein